MAVSRSRSGTPSLPKDLYYLAINFEPNRLTIPNLKNILLKHHVSPVDCKRKADYVALFEAKVFSKREKIIKKHEDAAKEGIKMALGAQHNRPTTVEEGSDSDTSTASPQTTDSEDSNDEEAVGGVSSLNFESPLKTVSVSEPPPSPSKSRHTSKQPTLSPSPSVRKPSTAAQQLEELGGRLSLLEYTVRQLVDQDSSEQIDALTEAMTRLWVSVCGKKAEIKHGHKTGKGKGRANKIAFNTINEEEEF